VSCAAGVAVVDVMQQEDIFANVQARSVFLFKFKGFLSDLYNSGQVNSFLLSTA
jgi:4-aminobutyrate aminotransferase-like enzyme